MRDGHLVARPLDCGVSLFKASRARWHWPILATIGHA